jgi:hypothetical protein
MQKEGLMRRAALAEFDQTAGRWEAVRWAAGGLRAVWHERRARIKTPPTRVRVQRAAVGAALLAVDLPGSTDLAGCGHPVMSRQANGCPRPVPAGATAGTTHGPWQGRVRP